MGQGSLTICWANIVISFAKGKKLLRKKFAKVNDDLYQGVISCRSDEFEAAHLSLLNSFANSFERCTIPCYLASGERSKSKTPLDFRYDQSVFRMSNLASFNVCLTF